MKPIHHIRILKRLRGGLGTAVLLGILIPQLALANPLGPKVVSGQASFTAQGKTLSVTNSDRAIINWQDFSIAGGELTRFIQPTATSAVLNRVIGNNPSAIYGALQSNGRVYLVNSNGIFIGPSATIDVNGLVASTLNITDSDFKAGRINFSGGPLAGRIENQGAIRTPAGGSIYLIAPDITNSGVINAPNGDILLAAGRQVSLVESTTPEIAVVVSAPGNEALNLGRIIAEAGRIGIYGGLIRHRGIVSADSAVMDKTGAIRFRATKDITFDKDSVTTANGPKGGNITVQSTEGTTLVSGVVEAKGSSDRGGTIQILGTRVGVIDAAQIDASGEQGGGTVLVGGDYQGKNPDIQNAEATYLGKDAVIKADAITYGDGGKVILWANDWTRFYGSISARGGAAGGNGGFAEVSGKKNLGFHGFADLSSRKGKAGTLLLDPGDLYVGHNPGGATEDNTPPDFTTPVPTIDYFVDKTLLDGLTAMNVNLTATNDIIFNDSLVMDLSAAETLSITAGNAINMDSFGITTSLPGNFNITMNAGAGGIANIGNINVGTGTVSINSGGSITQGAGTGITASTLALPSGGVGIYTLNNTSNSIGNVSGNFGSLALRSSTGINVSSGLTASGSINLTAGGTISQGGGGVIQTNSLSTSSAGGTKLDDASNTVGSFSATNTGGGGILFDNLGAPITLGSISNSGGGDITIENTGNLIVGGNIGASTGVVYLTSGGAISGSGIISGSKLDAWANSNIGPLNTQVSQFAGDSPAGGISISNTGPLTANGVYAEGNIAISTSSPLTIGVDGVISDTGNITLQAGGNPPVPGKTGDILKLDGLVKATLGNITLSAGNEIIENVSPEAPSGTITRNPNLNAEAPPPTPTCPTGQELVGGVCQPITCPTGYHLVGSTCQAITCPTGQQLVGNTCQAIICPTGQELVGNLCQPIACPGGKVFIGTGCQCPAGTIDYAGACKTPSIVPGTDSSTVIYFPITEELTEPLQVLVKSIINTVDPSLFRTSGSPAGGAGDDLKPKKNYCN